MLVFAWLPAHSLGPSGQDLHLNLYVHMAFWVSGSTQGSRRWGNFFPLAMCVWGAHMHVCPGQPLLPNVVPPSALYTPMLFAFPQFFAAPLFLYQVRERKEKEEKRRQ